MNWKNTSSLSLVHKRATLSATKNGLKFVLTSERSAADRYGDVVVVAGIDHRNFDLNPICLAYHKHDEPIGFWDGLSIEGSTMTGYLHLAPPKTSPRMAEIHVLVDAKILRAVSIGFLVKESSPLKSGGQLFTKTELCEISLVAVPANADALLACKALGVSNATIKEIFKEQTRNANNKTATIAERIAASKKAVKRYTQQEKAEVLRRARATQNKNKPQPPLISPEAKAKAERLAYNREVLKRAKVRQRQYQKEKDEGKKLDLWARSDQPKPKPTEQFVFWRGQKIQIRNPEDDW
jgi:HK97 family phage prohead protease